jgi:chromosome segregation ATPase
MSLTIETELKEIFTKIDQRLDRMDQRFDRMEQNIMDLKLGQAELKGEVKTLGTELRGEINSLSTALKGEIKTLDTRVDGLSTRVSNQEFLLRTIVGGLVLIILGSVAKMLWNFPMSS